MDASSYAKSAFREPRRTPGRHGYTAYFPAHIPRTIELPSRTVRLLADAEASLGRLAGVGQLVPNPALLIRPYLLEDVGVLEEGHAGPRSQRRYLARDLMDAVTDSTMS